MSRKNIHRPVRNVHITYKGHYLINIRDPLVPTFMGVCYENGTTNDTPHTHVVLQLAEPCTTARLIRKLTKELEIDCQI